MLCASSEDAIIQILQALVYRVHVLSSGYTVRYIARNVKGGILGELGRNLDARPYIYI